MTPSLPFTGEVELLQWEAAIDRQPKRAELRYGYAVSLQGADDPAAAMEQCSLALSLNPRLREAAKLLAGLLQRYEVNAELEITPRGLEAAFAFPDVDRQALSVAAIRYLTLQPPLAALLATGRDQGLDAAAAALLSRQGQKLLKDRLFRTALAHGCNTDPEVEFLLTGFRRHLLLTGDRDLLRDRAVYDFACAVVRQCINNEYVFYADDDELEALHLIEAALENGDDLLRLALYRLPHMLDPQRLRKLAPRALRDVLQPEWDNRRDEAARASSVTSLTDISDSTSQQVAQQYAEDPYPRWLSLQAPAPGTARQVMTAYFPPDALAFMNNPFDVLIAGCGTGHQAVAAALAYGPDANCLAIDLSRRSLAYAARMAEHYSTANLHFAQADILGLADTDQHFDLIECVGVLHHMAQPYEAWRILTDRLNPGGIMLVGLYSSVSRRNFDALRSDPAWPGADADDTALRAYRRVIMQRAPGEPGTELLISRDFYAKSGFRDLALHVSEQHCTLPDIRRFLDDNGLTFHGFRLPPNTVADFARAFPDDIFPGQLENWWTFEQDNPRSFDGMYVFWCRKG